MVYPQHQNYSMIFSTKSNQLAIFGKTLDEVKQKLISFNDVWMAGGKLGSNKPQTIPETNLTKVLSFDEARKQLEDFNRHVVQGGMSLDTYFKQYQNGNTVLKTYVTTTDQQSQSIQGLVKASEKARAAQIAHNEVIRQSTLAFKAASVAKRIFATIGNIAAMWTLSNAISVVTDTIGELIHSEENLRQSASELGSELSNNSSDIESYKKKIDGLKSVINDSSSSFNEVSQARVDLITIQDELIKKFGTEKGVIESITSAINDQTNALDELSRRSYYQAKNKFNEKTGGDKFADWLSFGNTNDDRIQSNMDKMVNSMRYSFYELETTGNEVLDNLIAKSYGLNIVEDMYGDGKHFQIYGTLDEIQDKLYGIQELSQDFDLSTGFENSFTKISNDVDDALAKFKNLYDQYVLYEKILTNNPNNQYDEQFDLINKAKEAYNKAVKSGNEEEIKTSADEYAKTLQSAIDLAMGNYDYDVSDYFKSMYPELQQMFGEWQFNLNFEPNTNGLQDKVTTALDSIDGVSDGTTSFSVEDIENFNPSVATQEQIDAYGELNNIAESYGLTIKQLIILLQTMELIQSERYQQLVDTFGQENVDKLSPKDLEVAYTIENVGNMTFAQLQSEIEKTKQKANENSNLSNQLLNSSESLDKFQSTVKSAYDAYSTLLSGNYSSAELLDSIHAINQAASDMGSKMNWELIGDTNTNVLELGDVIDYISEKYAKSFLSDAGIDADSKFSQMLVNMVKESYKAEAEFAGMNAQLDNLQSSYQALTSVIESYNETGYISLDSLQSLLTADENLIAMLEVENGQLAINQAAYENLVTAQLMEFKAKLSNAAASEIEELAKQKAEEATNSNASASNNAVEKLDAETAAINRNTTAAISNAVAKAEESGVSEGEIQGILDKYNAIWNSALNNFGGDFSGFMGGGKKSAGTAGKEAADTYLEAFEKELKDLDDLKSDGKISEKQYLDALRRLYLKYFRDKEKYLKEYEKYEHQYLEGMKSLYESAFSYITKQIDKRIDAVNSQKDAAVSALEAERDARLEAIEAQKEQYEHEIEGIEAQIEAKEKEIKAMQDTNAERKRAIDLQKAEYELQRMQNQKTSFVYKDGQMVYEADTSGIRDAKQEVEDAKLEIDISKIEKEIDRLEEEKDLLQERIDLLDKEAEQVNQYYDQLIAQTEKHYDAMVKGLEDYKSQFEALTDLLENAQLEASLSELGINMDALLSGSQEEFEKLKTAYIGILADMSRGNDGVLEQLSRLSGISTESISYLNATKGALEELGNVTLEGLEESIGGIGESASTLSTSAGEASAAAGNIQESVRNMSQSIAPLNTELGNLKTLIGELIALLNSITFPEIGEEGYAQKLMDIAQAFGEIASKCGEFKNIDFSSIIGSASAPSTDGAAMPGGEGMEGAAGTGFLGLASAISEAVSSIDEQMGKLKTALDSGNSYFTGQIDVINEKYIPAWENLRTRLAEIIGVEGGDSEDKEGRGKQEAGSTDGGSASGGKPGSIIDIMQTGGDAVDAKLEDPWLKAFNDFATDGDNSIQTICDKIIDLVTKMAEIIQKKCEAAASALHSLAKTAESSLSAAGGSVSGNTVSGNPILVSPHAKGTASHAFAEGTGKYKGLAHDEKYALRSEYGQPELTVYPDGTAELTTEPVLGSLPKGTVIFNEEQTKHIMNNKGEELGNTHVEDTVVTRDGRVLLPITPDNELYRIQQKFEAYFKENKGAFIDPAAAMFKATESMDRVIETISHNNTMHQTMVTIGDIHLHEVQDAHSLSRELLLRFPNMLLQEAKKV